MKLLAILILATSAAMASELDDLITQLGNDEFEKREQASFKLNAYPEEYIKKFMDRSKIEKDPEIRYRLQSAAKQVFTRTVVERCDEWLILHADVGLEFSHTSTYRTEVDAENRSVTTYEVIYVVNFVNSEIIGDKIKQYDVVKAIDGNTDLNSMKPKMGKEHEIILHRYKNVEQIQNGNFDAADKEFEEIKVKIKVGAKEDRFINPIDEMMIIDSQWKKFCEEYNNVDVPKEKTD